MNMNGICSSLQSRILYQPILNDDIFHHKKKYNSIRYPHIYNIIWRYCNF